MVCAISEKRPSVDTSCAIIIVGKKRLFYPAEIWQDEDIFFALRQTENIKSENFLRIKMRRQVC